MPRTDARGGPQTRQRISNVATQLFIERGFDAVTVAEIARAAGVSSVTVFNHFPRKEDLLLDRAGDGEELLQQAIRDRGELSVLESLQRMALRLAEEGQAFAFLSPDAGPFFRTVAASPALIARAREIAANLQRTLAEELQRDARFTGDPALFAALFVAGYTTVALENARRLIDGEAPKSIEADHGVRVERLFGALRSGV